MAPGKAVLCLRTGRTSGIDRAYARVGPDMAFVVAHHVLQNIYRHSGCAALARLFRENWRSKALSKPSDFSHF